jgi:small nuclear ribonucleoprotein (snRNP)-like protein
VPQKVVLELKNDLKIAGTLQSVDENLNFYLTNMKMVDDETNPYLVSSRFHHNFSSSLARMASFEVTS